MIHFTSKLASDLQQELEIISVNTEDQFQKATRSFYAVNDAMFALKGFLSTYSFKDSTEEIKFFKETKPAFHKQLIFWMEVIHIEHTRPAGGKKRLQTYYLQTIRAIDIFFIRNNFLRTYYKMGQSSEDEQMFLRQSKYIPLIPEYNLDLDPNFSTVMSAKLSRLLAFEDLLVYIEAKLILLEQGAKPDQQTSKNKPLTWTGTKAQFIELGYALQSSGVLNHGKADVKQVMDWMQYCFNVRISNYYGYFQSMRIRKKDRTPFLKKLMEFVIRRMDESDEHPRFS